MIFFSLCVQMAEEYNEKRKRGEVKWGSNDGFSGSKGYNQNQN